MDCWLVRWVSLGGDPVSDIPLSGQAVPGSFGAGPGRRRRRRRPHPRSMAASIDTLLEAYAPALCNAFPVGCVGVPVVWRPSGLRVRVVESILALTPPVSVWYPEQEKMGGFHRPGPSRGDIKAALLMYLFRGRFLPETGRADRHFMPSVLAGE